MKSATELRVHGQTKCNKERKDPPAHDNEMGCALSEARRRPTKTAAAANFGNISAQRSSRETSKTACALSLVLLYVCAHRPTNAISVY